MDKFTACQDEPIHIPGHIQSYGYLIGLDETQQTIRFYSANITQLFGLQALLLGEKLENFPTEFAPVLECELFQHLEKYTQKEGEYYLDHIEIGPKEFHVLLYKHEEVIFLEFEEVLDTTKHKVFISNKYTTPRLSQNSAEIWNNLVHSISDIIGYDRVMIYRFLEDGTGKVIAEQTSPGLESYLGLHYPESDIPQQARALYIKKRERIFSDVDAQPVPIYGDCSDKLDLTYSSVRAMSPIHAQYLRNTGVASSFSTSIVVENRLWGMVTCQNIKVKHVDLLSRIRAEVFTALAANAYMSVKSQQKVEDINEFNEKTNHLRERLQQFSSVTESLFKNIGLLKDMVESDGMAIVVEGRIKTTGDVPAQKMIKKICEWHEGRVDKIYYSDSFMRDNAEEFGFDANAAGIFIAKLEGTRKQMLLWFRKEYREHIKWAGYDLKKPDTIDYFGKEKLVISPRKSFSVFLENIQGKSKHWQNKNIIAVEKVVPVILETSLNHSKKILQLNEELKQLNEELDSFSYTISHDLGTPLTVMKLNAQLLSRSQKGNPGVQKKLKSILQEIDGMEVMMRNVLELSRAKSSELQMQNVQLRPLIEKVADDIKITVGTEETKIIIEDCPDVLADQTMLTQIFQNVIGNAVKYSARSTLPTVIISGKENEQCIEYHIKDNGIGIAEADIEKLFKIFTRLDNARSFHGNGVGLSIVSRLVTRLKGTITCKSQLNEGTTFILNFQKPVENTLEESKLQHV